MYRREVIIFERQQKEPVPSSAASPDTAHQLLPKDQLAQLTATADVSSAGCYGCLTAVVEQCVTLLRAIASADSRHSKLLREGASVA